ncbi:hypothetical protein P3T17_006459 [Paraburkholderia sp. GAS82]|jgi:hypothetical protein
MSCRTKLSGCHPGTQLSLSSSRISRNAVHDDKLSLSRASNPGLLSESAFGCRRLGPMKLSLLYELVIVRTGASVQSVG